MIEIFSSGWKKRDFIWVVKRFAILSMFFETV